MINIYYAEDDAVIGQAVKEYLEEKGCRVRLFVSIGQMKRAVLEQRPGAALVDWNLPDGSGDTLCGWMRERWPSLPILLLTVRSQVKDIVSGFQSGADDYVTKPFELEVLHSRILALLRRTQGTEEARMVCDDLTLIPDRQTVLCGREEIPLSGQEYAILCMLMHNKGRTVTRRQLLDEIWDSNGNYVNDNTLTVTMKRLREKLHHPACLKTVRSFGYRMEDTL